MSDDEEDTTPPIAEEADVAAMLDLSKKKKKKKKKTKDVKVDASSSPAAATTSANENEQQQLLEELDNAQERPDLYDRKAEYTYDELLERIVSLLQKHNPDLVEKKRRNIKPPQLTLLWVAKRRCG